jgi:hypothetical protein
MEPYAVFEYAENKYRFVTESGNEYTIYFIEYWQQDVVNLLSTFPVNIFELFFEQLNRKKIGYDKRLPFTIFSILDKFLWYKKSIIYFIPQREDGRSKELSRLYQLWATLYYKNRITQSHIAKIDKTILYNDFPEAHLTCLFSKFHFISVSSIEKKLENILFEIYPNCQIKS